MRIGVLGAGPAAGAAALHLARSGIDVTVYTPGRPGEKPCGGAVPSYLLEELDGFDAETLPSVRAPSAKLENASGASVSLALPGLRVCRRGDLDPALLAAAREAGARVVRFRARSLYLGEGGVKVGAEDGSDSFDWVICADGARGLGRRTLELDPGVESVGLGASLSGVEFSTLVLFFPGIADAYLWIFPRPGGCSVGIAFTADRLSDGVARALLAEFVERHLGRPLAEYVGLRYRYPIPIYSQGTVAGVERGLEHRILLVGDAAGVADPLTREGIRHAMRSGRWASETLLREEPESYPRCLQSGLEKALGGARMASELFFEGPIGQWMVPVCHRHAGVRRVLADLLACRQPYRGLRWRLLGAALGVSASTSPGEVGRT